MKKTETKVGSTMSNNGGTVENGQETVGTVPATVEQVSSTMVPSVITVEGKLTDIALQAPLFAKLPKGKYIIEYRDSKMDVILPLPVFWDGEQLFA